MHRHSRSTPSDAGSQPLPRALSLATRGAMALGLALIILTAHPPAPAASFYTQPSTTTQTALANIAPALRHHARLPPVGSTSQAPLARDAPLSLSSSEVRSQSSVLRGFAWASLLMSLAASAAIATWNRLSTLNAELRATEAEDEADVIGTAWAGSALAGAALAISLSPSPAMAEIRLPPLDTDPLRCERAFTGNTIGQANGVSDRPLDLRMCDLAGKNLDSTTLSGALMSAGKFSGASFVEAVLSKAYAVGADFSGANFTSAVLDRGIFDKADMSGANFYNAVITGTTFEGTNLANANFEDALIGKEDAKRLCKNPTLAEESRAEVGCR